jgi:hypothetical protein
MAVVDDVLRRLDGWDGPLPEPVGDAPEGPQAGAP